MIAPSAINVQDLAGAGWGVILAPNLDPQVRGALAPLLELRRAQAGALYHELDYRPGETANAFLARQGVGPGPMSDPRRVPYYLLLVGEPSSIPFEFQIGLDVSYAVGRLDLECPDDYFQYAQAVVRAEQEHVAPQALFFSPTHPGDLHTDLLSQALIRPLAGRLGARGRWDVRTMLGAEATRAALLGELSSDDLPSLYLLAGHGLAFAPGGLEQLQSQGGLVCADWPGPEAGPGPVQAGWCFAAQDIPPQVALPGSIWLVYAAFSAGTDTSLPLPQMQDRLATGPRLAEAPFTARLARRLLSLPAGPILAFIGAVGPVWSCARGVGDYAYRLTIFEELMQRLMRGERLGPAMEGLSQRYASLAAGLADELEYAAFKPVDPNKITGVWADMQDARSLIVMGDPAVSLNVASYENLASQQMLKTAPSQKAWAGSFGLSGYETTAPEPAPTPPEAGHLDVELTPGMVQLPAWLYPYLPPAEYPLFRLRITNRHYEPVAVEVNASIEALAARQVETTTVPPLLAIEVAIAPALPPGALGQTSFPTRVKVQVIVTEVGGPGKPQVYEKFVRTTNPKEGKWREAGFFPLAVRDGTTAAWLDLSRYLGLFVDPHHPAVVSLLARAGAAGQAGDAEERVRALYGVAGVAGFRVSAQTFDYRYPDHIVLWQPALPAGPLERQELSGLQAALLFAGLLEAAGIEVALALAGGRALVAWQPGPPAADAWRYFDPTSTGARPFDEAARSAEEWVARVRSFKAAPGDYPPLRLVSVRDMRAAGIKPLG